MQTEVNVQCRLVAVDEVLDWEGRDKVLGWECETRRSEWIGWNGMGIQDMNIHLHTSQDNTLQYVLISYQLDNTLFTERHFSSSDMST